MNQILVLLLFFFCSEIVAQQLQFTPAQPYSDEIIHIRYDAGRMFADGIKVKCIAYFTGLNDHSKQPADFPIARVIQLKKSEDKWVGKVDSIPERSTSILFVFTDSLNHRDSNKGRGYYTPIYSNAQPLPGAWAGIGALLYGNWITDKSPFHIRYDLDSAMRFYDKDFSVHPEVKRDYFRQYLEVLKINTPREEQIYKKELEELAQFPDLSHAELLLLRFQYARLKDTVSANKYERKLFEKFPSGSWTVQAKSIKQLAAIGRERDFTKQSEVYKQFKSSYLKQYEDEDATFYMNYRAGQMLGYMVNHFAKEGTMDLWINEVNQLTNDGERHAYWTASRELMGLGVTEILQSNVKKHKSAEHVFLINNTDALTANTKIVDDLTMRVVEISRKNLDGARRFNEPLILTDEEVIDFRNSRLSSALDIRGISLLKQNRFAEAVEVMTEAVAKNLMEDSYINQTYIESLVRAGQIDKALSEIEKISAMGKSSGLIDSFYAKYKKKGNDITSFKDQSVETAKVALKEKMVREEMPDFIFHDQNGKEIKSSSLKNKIIVIDFWASWCPPCMITLEASDQLIDKYKQNSEVVFLLMGEDESRERAQRVIDQHKNKASFVFDQNRELVKKFAASLPTQIVIDKKGKVRFRTNGLTTFNVQQNAIELQAMIELLKGN